MTLKEQVVVELESKNQSNSLLTLRLTQISLLIFLLGIGIVGRRESTWPIITWVLYSTYTDRFRPPKPLVSTVELKVYTATGELHIVKPENILSVPYDSLSYDIVEQAFNDNNINLRDESRRYLLRAVTKLIRPDSEIKTIEAWKISYQVEPLKVPPIQLEAPMEKIMFGSCSQEDL